MLMTLLLMPTCGSQVQFLPNVTAGAVAVHRRSQRLASPMPQALGWISGMQSEAACNAVSNPLLIQGLTGRNPNHW